MEQYVIYFTCFISLHSYNFNYSYLWCLSNHKNNIKWIFEKQNDRLNSNFTSAAREM